MIKRAFLLMLLMALPLLAEANEEALFPAMGENGQFGYINAMGAWVIPPQFDGAGEFRGDYAVIIVYPHEDARENPWDYDVEGIIDRSGNIVLTPEYSIDGGYGGGYYGGKDTGIWHITQYEKNVWDPEDESLIYASKDGFFDIPSGHFSGLKWDMVWPWCSDSHLIPVVNDLTGYADRRTGELVIPCQYFAYDPSNFHEGVASVAFVDEDWNATDFFLINEHGEEIPLPEGIVSLYGHPASEGRIAIEEKASGLLGFADLQGNVVIPPQFTYVNEFSDGYTVVQFPEGDWGMVDANGAIIRRGMESDHWSGFTYIRGMRSLQTGENEFSILNMQDEVLLTLKMENLVSLGVPIENGLSWFATDPSNQVNGWKDRKFGLVDIEGNIVSPAQWKLGDFENNGFSEGLQPVMQDGKWGYINTQGEIVIPLSYDRAASFEKGMAYAQMDGENLLIDSTGKVICSWSMGDED